MLKIRPYPHVGESQVGYALRLATANNLEKGLSDLKKILRHKSYDRIVYWENATMDSILGKSFSYEDIPLRQYGNKARRILRYNNRSIDNYHLNQHAKRYCPQCVKEHLYFRGDWDLSFVTVCEEHQCVLVDHCKKCDGGFSWDRCSHLHCDCGHPMEKNDITPTKPEVIALQKLILSSLAKLPADPEIFVAFPEFIALKDLKRWPIDVRIVDNFNRILDTQIMPCISFGIPTDVRLMHEAVLLFSSVIRASSFIRDIVVMDQSLKYFPHGPRPQLKEMRLPPLTSHLTSPNDFQ